MKRGVLIFWTIFIAAAIIRIGFSFNIESPDVEKCLKSAFNGVGQIVDEPERKENSQIFIVRASICEKEVLIRVKTKLYPEYAFEEYINFSGKISKPFNFKSDSGRAFDYEGYLAKDNVFFEIKSAVVSRVKQSEVLKADGNYTVFIQKVLYNLKHKFVSNLQNSLGEPHAALASGLVVGEKAALGAKLIDDFRIVGLIHIVVLSGFNITIVAAALRRMLSFLPRVWGIVAGGVGIALFGVLVGGGATVVRSCFMAGVALSADMIRRDYNVVRALIFAGLIMLIQNPMILLHDPSFQLSFMATLGLILLASPIEKRLTFIPEKFGIRSIVAATLSTQVFVSPYILYMMGQLSIIGVVVNILVLPFVPLTMLVVFLTGSGGFISIYISTFFGWIAHLLLSYELFLVETFAKLPFASVHLPIFSGWWVVGFYGALVGIFLWLSIKRNGRSHSTDIRIIFNQFQKIPKSILIDKPNELILTQFTVADTILKSLGKKTLKIFFTRRTLKHIAEKGKKGLRLFDSISSILNNPDEIRKGNSRQRFIVSLVKTVPKKEPRSVVLEIDQAGNCIVITTFTTDQEYLSNFDLLWRTGGSFS